MRGGEIGGVRDSLAEQGTFHPLQNLNPCSRKGQPLWSKRLCWCPRWGHPHLAPGQGAAEAGCRGGAATQEPAPNSWVGGPRVGEGTEETQQKGVAGNVVGQPPARGPALGCEEGAASEGLWAAQRVPDCLLEGFPGKSRRGRP